MGTQPVGEYISPPPKVHGVGGRRFNFGQMFPTRLEGAQVGGGSLTTPAARLPNQFGGAYLLWGCRTSGGLAKNWPGVPICPVEVGGYQDYPKVILEGCGPPGVWGGFWTAKVLGRGTSAGLGIWVVIFTPPCLG